VSAQEHSFVVMPRNTAVPLLSEEDAQVGAGMIMAHGHALRQRLLDSGILRLPDETEVAALRSCCGTAIAAMHGARAQANRTEFKTMLESLGVDIDKPGTDWPVFSLARFNHFFVNAIYVILIRPDGMDDGWPFLRCTCEPFTQHGKCEHISYARTLNLPNLRDERIADGEIPERRHGGRRKGSYTTARGAAKAKAQS
jgi:hypothetical protein